MDPKTKQKALRDAVRLSEVAFSNASGGITPFMRKDECARFVEALYHKLCDLYEDAAK